MSEIEKVIQIITMIVSGITLIWGIVSVFIVFRQKKAIAIMQKQLEKGTYVSNAVFDKLFEEIQKLSECLFCNYNNASVKLFPLLERVISNLPDDKKLEQMEKYYNESVEKFNDLVKLIYVNTFVLPQSMFDNLLEFEQEMKAIIMGYNDKMRDVAFGRTFENGAFTRENERELVEKSGNMSEIFKKIENDMFQYLNSLQVIYK